MFSFFSRSKPSPSEPEQATTSTTTTTTITSPQQPTTTTTTTTSRETPSTSSPSPSQSSTSSSSSDLPKLWTPQTNTKLFFGGLTFFTLSLLMTRRALHKRRIASIPPFYTSSLFHKPKVNGGAEAFEALNLATLNVLSFGMMASGGVLYLLGINGLEDMRAYVRKGMLGAEEAEQGLSEADKELEKEVEDWIGRYLGDRFKDLAKKEKEAEAVQGNKN